MDNGINSVRNGKIHNYSSLSQPLQLFTHSLSSFIEHQLDYQYVNDNGAIVLDQNPFRWCSMSLFGYFLFRLWIVKKKIRKIQHSDNHINTNYRTTLVSEHQSNIQSWIRTMNIPGSKSCWNLRGRQVSRSRLSCSYINSLPAEQITLVVNRLTGQGRKTSIRSS